MKTELTRLRRNFINLFKRAEKLHRNQGNTMNAVYCAEIRRAICAVRLPQEEADGARKEVCDGGAK